MNSVLIQDLLNICSQKKLFENLDNKVVLITGSTGLIGSLLVNSFLYANSIYGLNIKIIAQGRSLEKLTKKFSKNINLILLEKELDLVDVDCDYIFHTASPTASTEFITKPVECLNAIVEGTKSMLELAKRKQVKKFLYISSMEEYGVFDKDEEVTEEMIGVINHLNTRSCYSLGKRVSEHYCYLYFKEFNVEFSIARLAQTFGAGVSLEDRRVFMQFSNSVIAKKDIVLNTKGTTISNFCYTSDAIRGILYILKYGATGEAYNICNDEKKMSILDVANLIANEIANQQIKVIINNIDSSKTGYAPDNRMKLNSSKIKNLGWCPDFSIKEAYIRLIKYIEGEKL